jgi:hypothetical protein
MIVLLNLQMRIQPSGYLRSEFFLQSDLIDKCFKASFLRNTLNYSLYCLGLSYWW